MAKKALIGNKEEIHYSTGQIYGLRVHQIEDETNIFPVAEPAFRWVDCPDNVTAENLWHAYDESTSSFVELPLDINGVPNEEETPPV